MNKNSYYFTLNLVFNQGKIIEAIHPNSHSKGFTLIELSVVIIVIGLIVTGIIAGKTLVEQSKIQRVLSDLKRYRTAITAFQAQYQQLPGDLSNASQYWGTWNAESATGAMDGNNSHIVEQHSEDPDVWHHLFLAELIHFDNSSELISHVNGQYQRTDRNMPLGPFAETQYRFFGNFNIDYWQRFYAKKEGMNGLFFTSWPLQSRSGGSPAYMSLPSRIVYAIDKKIDDGIANKGSLFGSGGARKEDAVNINNEQSCSLAAYSVSPTTNVAYKLLNETDENCFFGYFF